MEGSAKNLSRSCHFNNICSLIMFDHSLYLQDRCIMYCVVGVCMYCFVCFRDRISGMELTNICRSHSLSNVVDFRISRSAQVSRKRLYRSFASAVG